MNSLKKENICIGIFGVSSQSGMAYFADLTNRGFKVVGYAWAEDQGRQVVDSINQNGGIQLVRPDNLNNELSKFVPLSDSVVTHDMAFMIEESDIIIIAIPSNFHVDAIISLGKTGLLKKRIPIILSPSRTFATPYLWEILGEEYPVVCFSTSPYSAKTLAPDSVFIKRRKRTWTASLEGSFTKAHERMIKEIFPQLALFEIPALTSLNNIGAIFHPATYLMNLDEIQKRAQQGKTFSFYMEGIAQRPEVGEVLEKIDQVRLQVAHSIGIDTFGLSCCPREDIWRKLTNGLRALEDEHEGEIDILRQIRRQFMEYINNSVLSAQHWLDITYGVERIPGESLGDAIGRTPTYQKNSIPQFRYIEEDIPTGLVPLEALAEMFSIEHSAISDIINLYQEKYDKNTRLNGRNIKGFSREYVLEYLTGTLFDH